MTAPATCGVWSTPRRLIAVLERSGTVVGTPAAIAKTREARWGFVTWLSATGAGAIVLTDELSGDGLIPLSLEAGLHVWLAPLQLVEGVRVAAALSRRPPRYTAALLARWPACPGLRPYLRQVPTRAEDRRQLALW